MKFFICFFCSIFFFISSLQILPLITTETHSITMFNLMHGGMFFIIPFFVLYQHLSSLYQSKLQHYQFNTLNFAWYKQTYPQCVNAYGDIRCYQCNSNKINGQRLFNHTYQVSQQCKNCRAFLFYAPE